MLGSVVQVCTFCGRSPTTKEHVISVRLGIRLNELTGSKRGSYVRVHEGGRSEVWDDAPLAQTAKAVCGHCNNGWLAALEDQAAPLLLGLLIDTAGVRLTPKRQKTLAAWAFGRAVVTEHLHAGRQRIPEAHRELFARTTEPPPDVLMWIAAAELTSRKDGMRRFFTAMTSSPGQSLDRNTTSPAPDYVVTMRFGAVLLQVAGGLTLDTAPSPVAGVDRIWPPGGSFEWPTVIFDGGGVEPGATDACIWLESRFRDKWIAPSPRVVRVRDSG